MPQSQTQFALHVSRRSTVLARMIDGVRVAALRQRERRQLAALDPHLLRDIGVDSRAAESECAKPFWRP